MCPRYYKLLSATPKQAPPAFSPLPPPAFHFSSWFFPFSFFSRVLCLLWKPGASAIALHDPWLQDANDLAPCANDLHDQWPLPMTTAFVNDTHGTRRPPMTVTTHGPYQPTTFGDPRRLLASPTTITILTTCKRTS
ncbi:hypothetical protein C8R43DRAFT_1111660 [Mycena crocata]|nr:hypothetical protein C8R43DRAFT_1111660 [Mycena crocata]